MTWLYLLHALGSVKQTISHIDQQKNPNPCLLSKNFTSIWSILIELLASTSIGFGRAYFTKCSIRKIPAPLCSECCACIERRHADDTFGTLAGTTLEHGRTSGSVYWSQSPFANHGACNPAYWFLPVACVLLAAGCLLVVWVLLVAPYHSGCGQLVESVYSTSWLSSPV